MVSFAWLLLLQQNGTANGASVAKPAEIAPLTDTVATVVVLFRASRPTVGMNRASGQERRELTLNKYPSTHCCVDCVGEVLMALPGWMDVVGQLG